MDYQVIYQAGMDASLIHIQPYKRYVAIFKYPDGLDQAVLTLLNQIVLGKWYNTLYTDIYIYDWELDTLNNQVKIYFMTSGTPASVVILAILAIIGGVIAYYMLKEIRLITVGTPTQPSPVGFGVNILLVGLGLLLILGIVKGVSK